MGVTVRTQVIALLGSPVSHSRSPLMQNAVYQAMGLDFVYVAFDVGLERAEEAVRALRVLGLRGANVTMPLKRAVLPYLDRLEPAALPAPEPDAGADPHDPRRVDRDAGGVEGPLERAARLLVEQLHALTGELVPDSVCFGEVLRFAGFGACRDPRFDCARLEPSGGRAPVANS